MRHMLVAAVMLGAVALCGCSYVETGDPGFFPSDQVPVYRGSFDAVEPGMTRLQIATMLGGPSNEAATWMHWQPTKSADAWVFFDQTGSKVTGKYWQDQDTLRLDEIPPYMDVAE